jgi:hypothetical protein
MHGVTFHGEVLHAFFIGAQFVEFTQGFDQQGALLGKTQFAGE